MSGMVEEIIDIVRRDDERFTERLMVYVQVVAVTVAVVLIVLYHFGWVGTCGVELI